MSIVPISVSVCATAERMPSWSVTSSGTTCASPPSASISARRVFSRSTRRRQARRRRRLGQDARKLRAEAARGAGDERDAARKDRCCSS
jgi:hypothetical protein